MGNGLDVHGRRQEKSVLHRAATPWLSISASNADLSLVDSLTCVNARGWSATRLTLDLHLSHWKRAASALK